ncbi:F19K23.12 gene product [Arabidopsis thaliana]|jgi:ubiquitin-conjugating enzyme E2 variant|uniref:Fatty acid desaturase 4-like 1, chloroplastic n=1 Tax=Arabidopsis thaliana TaxID=3702 RepID=FD4L1_ARATH|nr:Kua-ubiquitin conjugating enzyme hybrid localization domain-containing protein [Arabidopsis thaliana]O04584.1 RecName: Full=Fatty acid desaturase 4-like 1, chloroplastic; Short=FAD4-L1; Flags: Precursor [Arabidopsis thaliana]AAB60765.1 F19K23.12 gene product [Arabidopsis thaliana]AEE33934.1 Kua-ubiquitin conjugating enzyme hybrid localization domain-containing protein [Arabidopsis thaliana]|eukprot:NP_176410.1 Kua-ubiquitin conjugating enzyme hybrid localization domain-containing protein [Arabidopsis thaliana]
MAVSFQTKNPLRPITNIPRSYGPTRVRVTCSVTTTNPQLNHENLVVEKRLVNPPLSKNNDPTLQSTWTHRLWVAAGSTTIFASFAKSIIGGFGSHLWLQPALACYAGYVFADLGSGVYHWAIDNYGGASTPIVGAQLEASQGHHKYPWTITKRQFANNSYTIARAITFIVLPLNLAINNPLFHSFVSTFAFCILLSQQFHAWAHGTKSKLPPLVMALQDMGLLVSRKDHPGHHQAPYNSNYCVVSGAWNKVLDESNLFKALEMALFFQFGVRPNSWNEPNSDWTEETETNFFTKI